MRSSSVQYLAKEGLRNVKSNRLMSLASVGVLSACLLLVGFAVLFIINMDSLIGYVEEQSTLAIFLQDSATDKQKNEMKAALEEMDCVQEVQYISKEQAMKDYLSQLNDEDLLNNLELEGENFLPASFQVSIDDLNKIDQVVEQAEQHAAYESFSAPTNVADTIVSLKQTVAGFGIGIVAALTIVSLVIISNTIRATVFARRREIGIMKDVGATNNFIRIPFLFEGVILGLIAAVISFLAIWLGYVLILQALQNNSSAFLQSMFASVIPFSHVAIPLALSFLLAGSATGALGSVISLRTHLKV